MKKILSIALVLIMILGLVACGEEEGAPDGYQMISSDRDPFCLYVPKTWTNNSESGVTSAFLSNEKQAIVSAVSETVQDNITLSAYVEGLTDSYKAAFENSFFQIEKKPKETTLGALPAYEFEYSFWQGGSRLYLLCDVSRSGAYYVVLTFCASYDFFEDYRSAFTDIKSQFVFRDPVEPETDLPSDKPDGHEGYKLASDNKYEFRFYVPESWEIDTTADFPSAKASGMFDPSNVSLISHVISGGVVDSQTYWNQFKENYQYPINDEAVLDGAKLGKFGAFGVEYSTAIGDNTYRIHQVFLSTSNIIYIFTYTSTDEYYDAHKAEVAGMLGQFEFH